MAEVTESSAKTQLVSPSASGTVFMT